MASMPDWEAAIQAQDSWEIEPNSSVSHTVQFLRHLYRSTSAAASDGAVTSSLMSGYRDVS